MTLNKNTSSAFNIKLLEKIPEVLGKSSDQFLIDDVHTNKDGTQETRKTYELPARETFLMAMSMSYELQAATYDYMRELDRQNSGYLRYSIEELEKLASAARQNPNKDSMDTSDSLKEYQDGIALLERAEHMAGILNRLWSGWLKNEAENKSAAI
ncbi:hypothetical protein [Klebsiella pneumoniae]|uniref:hypothetical protein n=1 Tax=Klebsiella pneumoniae TaxID=573 RepID=UPI0008028B1C|nr:hypothetical protein [Klebsiella pneumoniae]SBG43374.1 Uncharacterised protein [Klebsiella pneumoniae]HBZ1063843.1 hypothetical protein [Klebsiella pneumoniae]